MLQTIAFVIAAAASGTPSQASPALERPPCTCRLRSGRRVPLGTRTCLRVDGRTYTAECRLSQNVSTWREVRAGCETPSS